MPEHASPVGSGRGFLDLDFTQHLDRIAGNSARDSGADAFSPRESLYANGGDVDGNSRGQQAAPKISMQKAKVSRGSSTVGLSVYGNRVDYVVPGGPAHLSRQLAADDEIVQVDGKAVSDADVPAAIVGSDRPNTAVELMVRTSLLGRRFSCGL